MVVAGPTGGGGDGGPPRVVCTTPRSQIELQCLDAPRGGRVSSGPGFVRGASRLEPLGQIALAAEDTISPDERRRLRRWGEGFLGQGDRARHQAESVAG